MESADCSLQHIKLSHVTKKYIGFDIVSREQLRYWRIAHNQLKPTHSASNGFRALASDTAIIKAS